MGWTDVRRGSSMYNLFHIIQFFSDLVALLGVKEKTPKRSSNY